MRRVALAFGLLLLVGVGLLVFWPSAEPDTATTGVEPARNVVLQPSRWTSRTTPRGNRVLRGKVVRADGTPVERATVTAVAAHGDEVLSDLPCQCDQHCGQKLLECGCGEAAGQLVELVSQRVGETAPIARTTTDAAGAFALEGLDDVSVTLWADAPSLVGLEREVAATSADVTITVTAGRFVRGSVTHTDGGPASSALVTAIFAERSRFFDGVAGADGTFTLGPLPQGTASVVALQDGLLPDHKTLRKDNDEPIKLELAIPRLISGQVLSDGQPVSTVDVRVEGMHRKRRVVTDSNGRFTVDRLRWGDYEVLAEGAAGFASRKVTLSKHGDLTGLILEFEAARPFSGTVADATGTPIVGAQVSIDDRKDWRSVDTDEAGRFHFPTAREGTFSLFVRARGWVAHRSEVTTGTSKQVVLERSSVVSGRVETLGGVTVPVFELQAAVLDGGAVVVDRQALSHDSRDGGFELDLAAGPYRLTVSSKTLATVHVDVVAPRSGLVVRLPAGGSVTGTVVDVDGLAVAKAVVLAVPEHDRVWESTDLKRTNSDEQGRFSLIGLAVGRWRIEASPRGEQSHWVARATVATREGVATEVTLRPKAGVAVAGIVISSEGKPVPDIAMMGWSTPKGNSTEPADGYDFEQTMAGGYERTKSDAEGRFRFKTLQAGRGTAVAGDNVAVVSFTAPTANLIIKLPPSTSLAGRIVNGEGKPLSVFSVNHVEFDSPDGRFVVPVEPGSHTIGVDSLGFAQKIIKVQVAKGERAELGDIVLGRGRRLKGRVLDAETRVPIAGAFVDVGLEKPEPGFFLSEERGAVVTDGTGQFTLSVDPTSAWVCVTHPEFEPLTQPLTGTPQELLLKRGAVLEVAVLDEAGAPIPEANVWVRSERDAPHWGNAIEGGRLRVTGLSAGEWTVGAATRSGPLPHRPMSVVVSAGVRQLVMRPPTDGVEVRVDIRDEFDWVGLVPGRLTLEQLDGKSAWEHAIEVIGGKAKHVLPGDYTLTVGRTHDGRAQRAVQLIKVSQSAENAVTMVPQWQDGPAD